MESGRTAAAQVFGSTAQSRTRPPELSFFLNSIAEVFRDRRRFGRRPPVCFNEIPMSDGTKNDQTIVILAAAPGRLQEVDRFLGRRGWTVRLRSDLKSFLSDVAALKPRCALISIDFKHPNLEKVRPLLGSIYRSIVIDFAEEPGEDGWARLKETDSPHKIFGALTGPAIERALARLTAESPALNREKAEAALREKSRGLLDGVFAAGDGVIQRPLSWASRMTCVQVRTPVLNGHFVVALGADRAMDVDLTATFREAVLELLRAVGFASATAESFDIDVRRVEFKRWALSAAAFLERGVHEGTEVAMAFIPAEDELFRLEESVREDMVSFALDEIRPEAKVDFELYIHLPLNGKFVLYVSRGGWLSLQQQLSLQSRGVSRFHAKKDERALILRERAHRRFDRLIADFYENADRAAA